MPVLLTKTEASDLFAHLNHGKNPRKNMHTRDIVKPTKGKREWAYLNGMKLTGHVISGHVHYRNGEEIAYQIRKDGTYVITNTIGVSPANADTKITSLKKIIQQTVARGHSKTAIRKTSPNQYYLIRQNWGLNKTATAAIKAGDLSKDFLTKMAKWELCLIKGR